MDIEWAKDGVSGKLFIVQARPETVKSRSHATQIERFALTEKGGKVLAEAVPSAPRSVRAWPAW